MFLGYFFGLHKLMTVRRVRLNLKSVVFVELKFTLVKALVSKSQYRPTLICI